MLKKVLSVALVGLLGGAFIFGCGKRDGNNLPESKEMAAANIRKVKLDIEGMTCTGCEYSVETALTKIAGVTNAEANYEGKSVEVAFDPEVAAVAQLVEAVNKTGFKAKAEELN